MKNKFINFLISRINTKNIEKYSKQYSIDSMLNATTLSHVSPVVAVYYALNKVYENKIDTLSIFGIYAFYNTEKQIYEVHIGTNRPGFIIGKCGKNVDMLNDILEQMFNNKIEIHLSDNNVDFIKWIAYNDMLKN